MINLAYWNNKRFLQNILGHSAVGKEASCTIIKNENDIKKRYTIFCSTTPD